MADYYNSIITSYNTDDNGNIVPKLIQNENIKVLFNGIALLDEIPYKPYGVYISGYTEVSSGTALTSTQFYVEYNGAGARKIHFAVSEIGKHLTVTYKGLGKNCIIAANIATEYTEDGDIVQSLADYIDQYVEVMDAHRIHSQVIKYTATTSITTIPYADITGLTWNPAYDNLVIIKDNLQLIENENYSKNDTGITLYEPLNIGDSIFFTVFRGLLADVPAPSSDGSLILNGSIAKFKLEQSVQDKIDLVPIHETEITDLQVSAALLDEMSKQPIGADKTGVVDSTSILQSKIDSLQDGDTLWLHGNYKVSQLSFNGKNNIRITGNGTITQVATVSDTYTDNHSLSNQPMINIYNSNYITIDSIKLLPQYEGICVINSPFTLIKNVRIDGQNNSAGFSGMFISSADVTIDGCKVENCGVMPVWNGTQNPYSSGHGLSITVASNVKILNNTIINNAKNGIQVFACRNIIISNNLINGNGMSGIQIAFGGDNTILYGYTITNNYIENNYADGIDINNATNTLFSMKIIIGYNNLRHNGYISTNITQDGSGIATLIYVKDATIIGNEVYDCTRTGLHIYQCEDIRVGENIIEKISGSLGEGIYIENSTNVLLNGVSVKTNGEGLKLYGTLKDVLINNNKIESSGSMSLVLPTSLTTYTNVSIKNNVFIGVGTINGLINLEHNYIESTTGIGLSVVNTQIKICNNTIKGNTIGLQVSGQNNVLIFGNELIGTTNNGLQIDSSSTNIKVINNKITTPSSSPSLHVLGSSGEIRLINNTIIGGLGNNIRLEPNACGTVYSDNNVLLNGTSEWGNGTVKTLQWL